MFLELKPKCGVCGRVIQPKRILISLENESVIFVGYCPVCQKTRAAEMKISDLYLMIVREKMRLGKGNGSDAS